MNKTAKGPRALRSSEAMGFLARARPESLDHGPADLTAEHISARYAGIASAAPDGNRGRLRIPWMLRLAVAGAGLAVAAGAVAVGASGTGPAPSSAVLTAALVRQAASVSRSEFAVSGQATISYRSHGLTPERGTDQITFSGKNWDDRSSWAAPAAAGHPGTVHQSRDDRVVNGRAYYDIPARNGRLTWYEDTSPGAAYRLHIPDPRSLLNLLTPAAGFQHAGYQTIAGVRLACLRATRTGGLGGLSMLPEAWPGERVTALQVCVDRRGVVHRMELTLRGATRVWHLTHRGIRAMKYRVLTPYYLRQLERHGEVVAATRPEVTVLSVTFSRIGQPQHITAPPHPIRVRGQG